MEPLLTAIVSAYYAEKYVEERFRNLEEQIPRLRVVVVCQEGSPEHKAALGYPLFEIIPTQGIPTLYDAWNMALYRTHTPYVTNANSDDRFLEQGARKLVQLLEDNPEADIAVGTTMQSAHVFTRPPKSPDLAILLKKRGYFLGSMPLWRWSLHARNGFYNPHYRIAGDYEFFLRCCLNGARIISTQEVIGYYPQHKNSLANANTRLCLAEYEQIARRYGGKTYA